MFKFFYSFFQYFIKIFSIIQHLVQSMFSNISSKYIKIFMAINRADQFYVPFIQSLFGMAVFIANMSKAPSQRFFNIFSTYKAVMFSCLSYSQEYLFFSSCHYFLNNKLNSFSFPSLINTFFFNFVISAFVFISHKSFNFSKLSQYTFIK